MYSPKRRTYQFKFILSVFVMLSAVTAFSFTELTGERVDATIRISMDEDNGCRYEISQAGEVLSNQAAFTVKFNETVTFVADGVDVLVVAGAHNEPGHAKHGLPAFKGGPKKSIFTVDSGRNERKTVRRSHEHRTTHRINMSCITSGDDDDGLTFDALKSGPQSDDLTESVLVSARPWNDNSSQAPEPDMTVEDP